MTSARPGVRRLFAALRPDSPAARTALAAATAAWTLHGGVAAPVSAGPVEGSGRLVWGGDFPDAFVLEDDGILWAYGTNVPGSVNVQVLRSDDHGQTWSMQPDALPQLPAWARTGQTWAPAVARFGEEYVMYYSAPEAATGYKAISYATANNPGGPFIDSSAEPFISDPNHWGVIDPDIVFDDAGEPWLAWKAENSEFSNAARLWEQRLSSDGKSRVGQASPMFAATAVWEDNIVEAVTRVRIAKELWIAYYSGGHWQDSSYGVGYAVGPGPGGPWRKVTTTQPWLGASGEGPGPGSTAVYRGVDETLRLMWSRGITSDVGEHSAKRRALWQAEVAVSLHDDGRLRSITLRPVDSPGGREADTGTASEAPMPPRTPRTPRVPPAARRR